MPKVSVIVFADNTALVLARCLYSIVIQTLTDTEVIVICNRGAYQCISTCNNFAERHGNVRIVQLDAPSLADAYDTGISKACGKYIMFVKADDFLSPKACELMYDNAIKNDSDLVKCGILQYSSFKDEYYSLKWESNILSKIAESDDVFLLEQHKELLTYHGSVWATLFKTDFISGMKFSEGCGASHQDFAYIIKAMVCASRISVVNDTLYVWNINDAEYPASNTSEALLGIIDPFESIKNWLVERGCFDDYIPELYKQIMIVTMGYYNFMSDELKPVFFKQLQQFYSDVNMFVFPRVTQMFSTPQVRFLIDILKDN